MNMMRCCGESICIEIQMKTKIAPSKSVTKDYRSQDAGYDSHDTESLYKKNGKTQPTVVEGKPGEERKVNGSVGTLSVASSTNSLGIFMSDFDTSQEDMIEIAQLVKQALRGKGKAFQLFKLLLLMGIPLCGLLILSALTLSSVVQEYKQIKDAIDHISTYFKLDALVTNLQIERGTSATYLSSNGLNTGAFDRLLDIRMKSDHLIMDLNPWPGIPFNNMDLTQENFQTILNALRHDVNSTSLTFEQSTRMYTDLNKALMDVATEYVMVRVDDTMWPMLVSVTSMLRCSDALGIQRALRATYFTLCGFSDDIYSWFIKLEGEIDVQQSMTFLYHPEAQHKWISILDESPIDEDIKRKKANIYSVRYREECKNATDDYRFDQSFIWFSNMTSYMGLYKSVRVELLTSIDVTLQGILKKQTRDVVIYGVLMVFILTMFIACLVYSAFYSKDIARLTGKIAQFANQMRIKSVELSKEKKRTETLLYQMLPKAVADQLRAGKEVDAEHFDSVTIFFSDIMGFTEICAKSTPLQVVIMLNRIYSVMDASIDRYDVYKVETIGDAYMVVSGLPIRNNCHAQEIGKMALDMCSSISVLQIPHQSDQTFKIRIGVHTGSCVAGVVGNKMPRYCLFGDTVNTASRMESSGEPLKIHISDSTAQMLSMVDGFDVIPRGVVDVKGKGQMKTHWLINYREQPIKSAVTFQISAPLEY